MAARVRTPADPLLDVHDVAALFAMHPETVREMARKGVIPALKLGGRTSPYRFRQSSINEYLARLEAKNDRRKAG